MPSGILSGGEPYVVAAYIVTMAVIVPYTLLMIARARWEKVL